jgi:hypothetical protein
VWCACQATSARVCVCAKAQPNSIFECRWHFRAWAMSCHRHAPCSLLLLPLHLPLSLETACVPPCERGCAPRCGAAVRALVPRPRGVPVLQRACTVAELVMCRLACMECVRGDVPACMYGVCAWCAGLLVWSVCCAAWARAAVWLHSCRARVLAPGVCLGAQQGCRSGWLTLLAPAWCDCAQRFLAVLPHSTSCVLALRRCVTATPR